MNARKESTSLTKESTEHSYFFICSGNASIINAYNDQFQVGARDYNGSAGHYYANVSNLDARKQEASKASLPFVGESYMGSKSTPVSHVHEVLQTLTVGLGREIHIAFVSVQTGVQWLPNLTGASWVHKVYAKLLQQAMSQGILPYKMYITKDKDAAQFLLGSFEKSS